MRKLFLACIVFLSLAGCDFHGHHHPHPPMDNYVVYEYYDHGTASISGVCWGETEPFWEYPDYCDNYCCVWYAGDGCYEEWCYFNDVCGWEYYQGWCY